MAPINPYIAGDPVGNSLSFVGREDVLREVIKVLRSPSQNAITLFGQRRIGKTSMLQFLKARLPQEGAYRAVYFDLQDKAAWPLPRLLSELARRVADELGQPHPNLPADQTEPFRVWMKEMLATLPAQSSVVLLFDEFDVLADPQAGSSVQEFFPYLRNLLSLDPAHLQFVFVLGRNITDLGSFALSVFKGTPSKRVSLLNQADTFQLIHLSEQNASLTWTAEALDKVWKLTHGHPYLTQALCSQIWEAAYDEEPELPPTATPQMVEAAASPALAASRNTLEWLWNGLGPAEKVVSAALAGAGPVIVDETRLEEILGESGVRILIRELVNAPQQLEDWDILEKADGGHIFRVELLRRWIANYHPLSRTQEEIDRIQPAAENLYQAAESFFQQGNLATAENLLRQALGINPNHLKANEQLAQILIANQRYAEARELLEKLFEFAPNVARPRLVQVYLLQVGTVSQAAQKLTLYDKVLAIAPNHPQALAEKQQLLFETEAGKLRKLLAAQKYEQILPLLDGLAAQFPEGQIDGKSWAEIRQTCLTQVDLVKNYQAAVAALKDKKPEAALPLLLAVVAVDPHYQEATGLLHEAVTGDNLPTLKSLANSNLSLLRQYRADLEQAGQETEKLKTSLTKKDELIQKLEAEKHDLATQVTAKESRIATLEAKLRTLQTPSNPKPADQPIPAAPKTASPQPVQTEPPPQPLPFNRHNPFNQFKLLILAYLAPARFEDFVKKHDPAACYRAVGWAVYHLLWLPLILVFLALSLGHFPLATFALPTRVLPFLFCLPLTCWALIAIFSNLFDDHRIPILVMGWIGMSLFGLGLLFGAVYQAPWGWLAITLVFLSWGLIAPLYPIETKENTPESNTYSILDNNTGLAGFAFVPMVSSLLVGDFTLSWQGGVLEIALAYLIPTSIIIGLIFWNDREQIRGTLATLFAGVISAVLAGAIFYFSTGRWMATDWFSTLRLVGLNVVAVFVMGLLGLILFGLGILLSQRVALKRLSFALLLVTLAALVGLLFFDGAAYLDQALGRKIFSIPTTTRLADNMSMVAIPGATFYMGSTANSNEMPIHPEPVAAYLIDLTEVTNQMYASCMTAGACQTTQDHTQMDDPKYKNYPASFIDWHRAQAYCTWAGARLPSEAEWEYAARGSNRRTYPWGNNWDCKKVNASGESCDGYSGTAPVGSFPLGRSPFGLDDMAGNVFEWVDDWYADYTASNFRINQSTESRLFRGGSIYEASDSLTTTHRFAGKPDGSTWDNFGFRCARSPQ
jgi:formylglycine-generating enzyme required for sulfatase activity/tetratricopeptide (TPR) repeat protein